MQQCRQKLQDVDLLRLQTEDQLLKLKGKINIKVRQARAEAELETREDLENKYIPEIEQLKQKNKDLTQEVA